MQTKAGGIKLKQTMIEKHGGYDAWCDWMRARASEGGKKGTTGGFYANRELASIAGRKGGLKSRRAIALNK